jgi:uncharacterized membrane protein
VDGGDCAFLGYYRKNHEFSMPLFLKLYAIALPVCLVFDALWLGVVAKSFYGKQIGALMVPQMNWVAAGLVYVVMIAGLVWFVITPAVQQHSWLHALYVGAFFGFVTYAVYDFTNLATLKGWPIPMVVVDMLWGTVLCALVAAITTIIATR